MVGGGHPSIVVKRSSSLMVNYSSLFGHALQSSFSVVFLISQHFFSPWSYFLTISFESVVGGGGASRSPASVVLGIHVIVSVSIVVVAGRER